MALVKQHLPNDCIAEVSHDVRQKLLESDYLNDIKPNAKIAITAGSRGMGGFVELLQGIIEAVKLKGGEPFLNFELIRYITHRAEEINLAEKRQLQFVIATNLALLSDTPFLYR